MSATTPLRSSGFGPDHLMAAERQQLTRERGRALRRRGDFGGRRVERMLGPQAAGDQFRVADDHRQQIVEVVRDAAGEAADRFELLRLMELRFEARVLGFHALPILELLAQLTVGFVELRGPFGDEASEAALARRDQADDGADARSGRRGRRARKPVSRYHGSSTRNSQRGGRRIDVPVAIDRAHVDAVHARGEPVQQRARRRSNSDDHAPLSTRHEYIRRRDEV